MSLKLYEHLGKDCENVFFSPFSISTALSMLLCGARGNTEQEMRDALHFSHVDIPSSEVHSLFGELLSVFNNDSDGMTLTFANAILSQKTMPILPEFKKTVEKTYRSLLMEVDFVKENQNTVQKVNDWVKEKTNGMIKEIIESLDPSTVMLLLNAIYFKGLWKFPFEPRCTRPRTFYNRGQSDQGKEVPMMFMSKKFRYVEMETYKALELPYKSDAVVMVLLLPKEMDGLKNLETQLTVELLSETIKSLYSCTVDVSLPKFRIEYSKTLSETFKKLGMVSAFNSSANFTGINSENICVSEILSKSVLEVNEEGTEAAAVTAVMMMKCSFVFNGEFQADHPFICIIYDKEKELILFIGRILEL